MADMRTKNWTTTVIGADLEAGQDLDRSGPIVITVGEPLPVDTDAAAGEKAMNFWEAAFDGGPAYKNALDCDGEPVLIRHEPLETDEGFNRRKRRAVYRNYCKTIVKRFNSFVFRVPVERDGGNEAWSEWCNDADDRGTPFTHFMRAAMKKAQVFGRYYLVVDSTKSIDSGDMTQIQAEEAGVRMFLRCIDPRRVQARRYVSGQLSEILVRVSATEAIMWDSTLMTLISLDDEGCVASVVPIAHTWPRMPVIELAPFEGDSQIKDIAELNKDLFNLESLLKEELFGTTFTQYWAIGVREDQLKQAIFGPNRVICIPSGDARIEVTGGKPEQAQSIRTSMADDVTEIYRIAGLKAEDPLDVNAPKSGVALKVEFDTVDVILAAIGDCAEQAENAVIECFAFVSNSDVKPTKYPDSYGTPDVEAELTRSLDAMASPYVVPTAKRLESQRLNGVLHPNASPNDREQMDAESAEMFIVVEESGPVVTGEGQAEGESGQNEENVGGAAQSETEEAAA